ncbi:MAG: hypothetical protein PUB43_05360 [Oscillospiraceae bacterium]|nr:hypothetical protein [Oscillospiraceae bacterium]
MRSFDYKKNAIELIDNEILNLIVDIHEMKVKMNCILEAEVYDFEDFARQARRESIISSNRMEYKYFSVDVDRTLINNFPLTIQEKEICGYNSALSDIFQAKRPYCVKDIDLIYKHFKKYDKSEKHFEMRDKNYRVCKYAKDDKFILDISPVDFSLIDQYIDRISFPSYQLMWSQEVNFLLVYSICILDLIKIYPFHFISEQIIGLLMTAMLWSADFRIVKYISIERIIEESSDEYYTAMAESLKYWEDGFNDYKPFVKYILGVILRAYKEFEKRTEYIIIEPLSKPDRVEQYIMDSKSDVTKREIMNYCPDISETTIEIALRELKNKGKIKKIGGGRYTKYRYNLGLL